MITSNVGGALRSRTLFCGPPPAGLLVAEGHALDPADEVGQGRVEHQVVEVVAVGRADQLDAALGDRPGGLGLELRPDLVDDDDLGHVVLDRLDHHLVLERRRPDLHPAGLADRRVRDVAVAGDLVRRVDDDDPLAEVVGEDAGGLAEHRRLADARPAHDQDRLPGLDEVVDDLDRPVDRPPDPAGQPDDLAVPVADRADPVERPLDARPGCRRRSVPMWSTTWAMSASSISRSRSVDLAVREARLRPAAEVEDDLDQRLLVGQRVDGVDDLRRQGGQERVEVVDRFAAPVSGQPMPPCGVSGRRPARGPARRRGRASPSSAGSRSRSYRSRRPRAADRSATRRSGPGR